MVFTLKPPFSYGKPGIFGCGARPWTPRSPGWSHHRQIGKMRIYSDFIWLVIWRDMWSYWLVVYLPTPLKNDGVSSSVGMMKFPIYIYIRIYIYIQYGLGNEPCEPGTEPFRNRQAKNRHEPNRQLFLRKPNGTEPVLKINFVSFRGIRKWFSRIENQIGKRNQL